MNIEHVRSLSRADDHVMQIAYTIVVTEIREIIRIRAMCDSIKGNQVCIYISVFCTEIIHDVQNKRSNDLRFFFLFFLRCSEARMILFNGYSRCLYFSNYFVNFFLRPFTVLCSNSFFFFDAYLLIRILCSKREYLKICPNFFIEKCVFYPINESTKNSQFNEKPNLKVL